MRAFFAYAGATAVLVAVLGLSVVAVVDGVDAGAVRLAAVLAWLVQLAAFAVLVKGRAGLGFMAAWVSGMALRFAVVGGAAIWVIRTPERDPASLLVSLVGFVFVLVLLEPLFLRLTD
ncbi:MAG: hypothetical protein ACOCVZ_10285 [Gemmatimonadota bacterium]